MKKTEKNDSRNLIDWWVACPKFTCRVTTDEDGIITWCAPITGVFVGQNILDLQRWAEKTFYGKCKVEEC